MPYPASIAANARALALTTPATRAEIAESLNTSIQSVSQALQRYGISPNTVESFKHQRAEIFAGLQDRILSSVDLATINEATLSQRAIAAGILYDKERLERGQSTVNQVSFHGDISAARDLLQAKSQRELSTDLSTGDDNGTSEGKPA